MISRNKISFQLNGVSSLRITFSPKIIFPTVCRYIFVMIRKYRYRTRVAIIVASAVLFSHDQAYHILVLRLFSHEFSHAQQPRHRWKQQETCTIVCLDAPFNRPITIRNHASLSGFHNLLYPAHFARIEHDFDSVRVLP